jgi:hypothetical protein
MVLVGFAIGVGVFVVFVVVDAMMAGWLDADAFCFSRQLGVECVFSRGDRDLSLKRIGRSE